MSQGVKPQSAAFLGASVAVGVLLITVGAFFGIQRHVFLVNVFAALGAAILGSALSLFVARVFEPSPMNEIYQLLSITNNFSLIADDEKVRPRRCKYHGYLLSHALGKPQWKYRIFDFTKDPRPGYLHARVDVWVPSESNKDNAIDDYAGPGTIEGGDASDAHPGNQVYIYNGYLCDPYHLLLVGRLDPELGTEPDVIQVFPFALKVQGNSAMAGLAFLETSDNKHVVAPTLLSRIRLTSETEFGPVVSAIEESRLMKTWQKQFLGDFQVNIPPTS